MTSYLAWHVTVGLSKSCELSFVLPGHAKFSPDRFFGMIKRKYRSTNVLSLAEIAQMVEESTQGVQNRVFVIGDEHPSQSFHYYDWANFLSNYFKHIPLITSYHHFHFSQEYPRQVAVCEFAETEEKKIDILNPNAVVNETALPATLSPSGYLKNLKQYLYDEIRRFCDEQYQDITCPEPFQKRPLTDPIGPGSSTESKSLCSYCRNPGHTKTCKGEISKTFCISKGLEST